MNNASKKILKTFFITSALSLLHTNNSDARERPAHDGISDGEGKDFLNALKPRIIRDILKIGQTEVSNMLQATDRIPPIALTLPIDLVQVITVRVIIVQAVHPQGHTAAELYRQHLRCTLWEIEQSARE